MNNIYLFKSFQGNLLKCVTAPDPTNIIWENIDLSYANIFIRRILSFLITSALLIIS